MIFPGFMLAKIAMHAKINYTQNKPFGIIHYGGRTMATLNISMPDEMREFIEARVNSGVYQSASDYLRDLIRHDRDKIDQMLMEGIESGESTPLNMATLRAKAQSFIKLEQGSKQDP